MFTTSYKQFLITLNNNNSLQPSNEMNSLFEKNQTSKFEILHERIQQIIIRRKSINKIIVPKNFKSLRKSFTIDDFVQYTKTNHFNSLGKVPKGILDNIISMTLVKDFKQEDLILSQNLDEYIKRGVIPELPSEYNNYSEYAESAKFNELNKKVKTRVKKLILLERRDKRRK